MIIYILSLRYHNFCKAACRGHFLEIEYEENPVW